LFQHDTSLHRAIGLLERHRPKVEGLDDAGAVMASPDARE
jgi:hypothetical protein